MNASLPTDPKVWEGWLRLKGGVEVAGTWVEKKDYDREIERLRSIIDTTRFHLVRGDHNVHGCVDQIIDAHEKALKPRTP